MTKRAKQSVGREFNRPIDGNAAEQAERGVALRGKNYLFAGRVPRVERAAALYSLIRTAKQHVA